MNELERAATELRRIVARNAYRWKMIGLHDIVDRCNFNDTRKQLNTYVPRRRMRPASSLYFYKYRCTSTLRNA